MKEVIVILIDFLPRRPPNFEEATRIGHTWVRYRAPEERTK